MNAAAGEQKRYREGWNERRSRSTLTWGFAALFIAVFANAAVAVYSSNADRWAVRTVETRQINTRLLTAVQAAESAERGYLITRDNRYIERFRSTQAIVVRWQNELAERVRSDPYTRPDHRALIQQLNALVNDKMAELRATLELVDGGQDAAATQAVRQHLQNDLMARVFSASNAMDQAESDLLVERGTKAGRSRWLLVAVVTALLLISGLLVYLVADALQQLLARSRASADKLANEIQEREATENQLRQAQKMEALGKLTGGVAHDFNNMLAVIVGNLDILSRHAADSDGRTRRLLHNSLEGAKRASELTHRLLAFSRLQPLAPKPLDINKCVADMSIILQRTIGEHIAVETVLGAGLWYSNIDRPQLESAILNLAVNAQHAMPERGGRLTIETANTYLDDSYAERNTELKPGQYVLIAVTDTGRGMSPDVVERAFEPFFTTKPVGVGTGLGLSQVHGFIKQSGGHVSIYSEERVGTTIKLYLPRYSGSLPDPDPWITERATREHRDVTVLVVEDEQGVRQFALDALRELGYRVIEAENAMAALRVLESNHEVGILLTDVVMPDMNGRQLVDEVSKRWPRIKVLYMTGYTRNAIVHNGVVDAGTRLLTKPFTLKQLETELQQLLS